MIFKRFGKKNPKPKRKKRARRNDLGPSIVTGEVVIDGHLQSGGELQIDGEINGDVRARAVVIDVNGVVRGEVAGVEVIVRGRIIGPIHGRHVHLLNGCHVEGDIVNETISIENGAFIDGQIRRVEDPLDNGHDQPAPSSYSSPQKSIYGYGGSTNGFKPNSTTLPDED